MEFPPPPPFEGIEGDELATDIKNSKATDDDALDVRVEGKIGPKPPKCGARMVSSHVVRVDCMNNLPFWLEIDVASWTAHGRYADDPANPVYTKGHFEVVHCDANYVRVTHTAATWFELDMRFNAPLPYVKSRVVKK